MAINKVLETQFGVSASYWKIIKMEIKFTDSVDSAEVLLAGFIDKNTSDISASPLKTAKFSWKGAQFPFRKQNILDNDGNLMKIAYTKIMEPVLDDVGIDKNPFSSGASV